ncbi:MAG TPA: ATP-binding protein [Actinomycetota bacterium]|nr:ATP-binding protein [Actinomycetota bacterium]
MPDVRGEPEREPAPDHGWRGPPWGGPPWGRGRPPWWPEDEAWPPQGPEAWRGMRRHIGRRIAAFFVLIFVAIAALSTLLGSLISRGGHRGPFFPLGILVVIVVIVLVARAGRRFAAPVAEVMEAADRVAGGDYRARVVERGPADVRRLAHSFNEMTERLGSSEERRRQLLADVTHELRTPLSVIRASLEAFVDGLYPTDEAHLRSVLEETTVMSRLLDDLQTLSTAEAGVLRLHREPTAPGDLVDVAVESFAAQARERGIALRADVEPDLPPIEVDRLRIGEVLANLLSNAVRHTARGGDVVAAVRRTPAGLELSVSDTGPGIPPEQLPHVFDRFSRSPDSPGAGLGLAIAKSLVEAHGGTIRADSSPSGTTIGFTLP